MLDLDDIQYILLNRAPARAGRYELLSFDSAVAGRAWLSAMMEQVQSVAAMRASIADEASLATFPEEFRQPIDLQRPHPFTAAGNTEFNCLLRLPPAGQRAGDILMVDSTHFTTLFGARPTSGSRRAP